MHSNMANKAGLLLLLLLLTIYFLLALRTFPQVVYQPKKLIKANLVERYYYYTAVKLAQQSLYHRLIFKYHNRPAYKSIIIHIQINKVQYHIKMHNRTKKIILRSNLLILLQHKRNSSQSINPNSPKNARQPQVSHVFR